MEDKELQELEEFTLEDIIREFSDHPVEAVSAELSEEAPAEVPEEKISEEQADAEQEEPEEIPQQTEEKLPAEEDPVCPEETLTEDTIALDEDFVAQFQKGLPDLTGDTIRLDEETLDEIREETEKAVSDTVRLDTAEILKGVAHNAQQITDEEEAALDGDTVRLDAEALEEAAKEAAAFAENWEPEYEQPMGEYVPPRPIVFPTRAESREIIRH